MRARSLGVLALAVAAAAGLAWWLLAAQATVSPAISGKALPGFDAQVESVDRIDVLGAGAQTLVSIVKRDGQWQMPSRQDWPANQREVTQALFRLGQATRVEAKTANPALHARLGVEDVASAQAKGSQLRLSGGAVQVQITVGNNHPALGGSYVRIGDEPQVWLLDTDIAPARNPVDWLDRRLLDMPMARIQRIRIVPAAGRAFTLSRRDDRFSLDGLPPTAMATPNIGNATAGFTDQLSLDEVAPDAGATAQQTVVFESVDGLDITVAAWTQGEGTWSRLSVELDPARAEAWLAQRQAASAEVTPEAGMAELRAQVAEWQARFQGHQFLLAAFKAEPLMRTRDDYLAGVE